MAWSQPGILAGLVFGVCIGPIQALNSPVVICTASSSPGPIYADGMAEPIADILVTCESASRGPGPADGDLRLTVSISLNTSVTNTILADQEGDLTDAVLVVNGNDCATPSAYGSVFGSCDAPDAGVQDPQFGRLTATHTLEWSDLTMPFPGGGPSTEGESHSSSLLVRGVRANVAPLGLAGNRDQPGLPVTATVAIRPAPSIVVRNGGLRVGFPTPALSLSVASDGLRSACSNDGQSNTSIQIREGFASAFRGGTINSTEPAPTRLVLEFEGVPDGGRVSVPSGVSCHQPQFDGTGADERDTLELGLVSGHDESGIGGLPSGGGMDPQPGIPLRLKSGQGRAFYEVLADDTSRVEDCHVPVAVDLGSEKPALPGIRVSGGLAPTGIIPVASPVGAIPRYQASLASLPVANGFARCRTNLLFPFVTSQAGFTTALVITHGSLSGFRGGAEAYAGPCDLHYYGVDSEGTQVLLVQHSTEIEPGEQLVFDLNEGAPDRNILGLEQFQGYLMAVCEYPNARGYAFIADGFGGIADIGMGYLAPVVSIDPEGRRAPGGGDPQ